MSAQPNLEACNADHTAPARSGVAITPSDSTPLTKYPTRGVWVGGAGNVNAVMSDGNAVVFTGVQAGTLLPIAVQRINSTSTTATSMVALY